MRTKTALARGGLVLFGLALTVLLLELALQLGSLFVAGDRSLPAGSWATPGQRILCLGDSNTYGVWLENRERDSYPAQLGRILAEDEEAYGPAEVLNLGYPGTNSSRLVSLYPELLDALAPDVVIVMVGANDFWTQPVPLTKNEKGAGPWAWIKRHSRLYMGLYMLQRRAEADGLVIEESERRKGMERREAVLRVDEHSFELGWEFESQPRRIAEPALRRNLDALVQLSEAANTRLLLMTYPSRWNFYLIANGVTREVVRDRGIPMVDLARTFLDLCPEQRCENYLYKDQHPTARGYERVAQTIAAALREQRAR